MDRIILLFVVLIHFFVHIVMTSGQAIFRSARTTPVSAHDTRVNPLLPGLHQTNNASVGHSDLNSDAAGGNDTFSGHNSSATPYNTTHASAGESLVSEAPSVVAQRTQLNACLMMQSGRGVWYDYDKSAGAMDLAVQYVNEQILSAVGFHLDTTYRDMGVGCLAKNHGVDYCLQLVDQGIHCDAYFGASCAYDFQTMSDIADFLDIPIIGLPAAGVGADADISQYTTSARVSVTHLNTVNVIIRFLRAYNYTTPTIFQDQDIAINQQFSTIMQGSIQKNEPVLDLNTKYVEIHSADLTNLEITSLLTKAITGSRVFILLTNATTTRQFMLMARNLRLINGDYVFIAVEMFKSASWGDFTWEHHDQFDQDAREAYQALLIVSVQLPINAAAEVFDAQVKAVSAVRPTNRYIYGPDEEVDVMTTHFYDSIVFYASIMRDMYLNGTDMFLIDNFNDWKRNYSFVSPISGMVTMDINGDRISTYEIKSLDSKSGNFVAGFTAPPSTVTNAIISLGNITWVGKPGFPTNAPYCGFDGKEPRCAPQPLAKSIIAAAAIVPTLFFLAGAIAGYVYLNRFLNRNKDPYWWRVFMHELTMVAAVSISKGSHVGSKFHSKKSLGDSEKGEEEAETTKLAFVLYAKTAYFRENMVALREFPPPLLRLSHELTNELSAVKTLQHNNIQEFYGIAVNDENLCEFAIGEVCQKGSLMALIEQKSLSLDWEFKYSLLKGIVAGMAYLHTTKVFSHGDLSAHTILIDSRFVVKISDYGLVYFRPIDDLVPPDEEDEDRDWARLMWRAPELLRRPVLNGSPKGDSYSFAIVLQQLILRSAPYESSLESQRSDYLTHARDLVMEVKKGVHPPQRPRVPISACPVVALHEIMETCWEEHPDTRYTFSRIRELFQKSLGKAGDNVIEHLINRMDVYANELEHEAEEKMKMFMSEKERSEELLKGMLPKSIGDKLRHGEMIFPETYESATVQFSDIHGFAEVLAAAPTPYVTIDIMNSLYAVCDHVIESFDVYKIETVVDCYLLVSGVPIRNGIKHAGVMASLALTLRKDVSLLTFPSSPDAKLRLRVGINSGSCVASVVGLKMPKYCLFGDTVNTASRMESHGEAGKIQVSPSTKDLLDKLGDYFLASRGEITVKGKGQMETFWLIAKTSIH